MSEPKKFWFPAKGYGWDWGPPKTWQGWGALGGIRDSFGLRQRTIPSGARGVVSNPVSANHVKADEFAEHPSKGLDAHAAGTLNDGSARPPSSKQTKNYGKQNPQLPSDPVSVSPSIAPQT
jgi:hypothetical protein